MAASILRMLPGQGMKRLRILVLGPECHPTRVSIPFVTYSHAAALARLHEVTLVAGAHVEDDLRRANAPFRAIEVVRMPILQRTKELCMRRIRPDSQVRTALEYPFAIAFEFLAWRQLRRRICAGEFDVVVRFYPLSVVLPSLFSRFLRHGPIPFVIGPLNGGLPWPSGFSQIEHQKGWVSGLRNLYRYMPFARTTYREAAAIIAASSQVCSEFSMYDDKVFFIPENGIERSACCDDSARREGGGPLQLIFVGGLIPLKACDLALRGAAPLLRAGLARFTVIGDGPEQDRLEQLTRTLGLAHAVTFAGWLNHEQVFSHLRSADVLVFPSLKDFGGGVVFEALASGAVPVVVDFGGPGDTVSEDVGYKVPLTTESEIVSGIESILKELAADRDHLGRLRRRGMAYARERLTWDAKAETTTQVLNWVVGRGPKPTLRPPKMLQVRRS